MLAEHYGILPRLQRLLSRSDDLVLNLGDRAMDESSRDALAGLFAALQSASDGIDPAQDWSQASDSALSCDSGGLDEYPGPWFGIVHGDLHGGNIMVDSRSYAWLIDYGEVEDAHVFKVRLAVQTCWPTVQPATLTCEC